MGKFQEKRVFWQALGWKHPVWEVLRYFCSLRGKSDLLEWKKSLGLRKIILGKSKTELLLPPEQVDLLNEYLEYRVSALEYALSVLRTEGQAIEFCRKAGMKFGTTKTKTASHHQSSKSLIAAVSAVAEAICEKHSITLNTNPQGRCVWYDAKGLHVTSRSLDGAIPALENPKIIWEIKEYWGKTKGGSKMSDAVYECSLVGRELREYEKIAEIRVSHLVFVDGKEQWSVRKSDLTRLIDLENQGLIDRLFIGSEVETNWEKYLDAIL